MGMTSILSIDPGAHAGWALSQQGQIVAVGLVRTRAGDRVRLFAPVDQVVCELPQWQYGDTTAKKVNDLITLARRAGWLVAQACPGLEENQVQWVHPHDWKKGVDKIIHNGRVWDRLTGPERDLVRAAASDSLRHNVIDACGLSLWASGRYRA